MKAQKSKKENQAQLEHIYSKEGQKEFKISLIKAMDIYSNSIQSQIKNEQAKSQEFIDIIKNTIGEVKKDIYGEMEKFENSSKQQLNDVRKIMIKAPNTRMKQLAKFIFPKGKEDEEEEEEERRKKNEKNLRGSVKRMSVLLSQNAEDAKSEYSKQEKKTKLEMIQESVKEFNKHDKSDLLGKTGSSFSTGDLGLDLWEKKMKKDHKTLNEVNNALLTYGQIPFEMKPINKFRSYVLCIMAARRLLNIQYTTYSEFKVSCVKTFIENYEDMDEIIKKLVYRSVRSTVLDCVNNMDLDINMITTDGVQHDVFLILQSTIEKMLNDLTDNFFKGVSRNMLAYLSLFITNYSYIPRGFFTTFESVRIRVTKTGEFVEMEREQQKMILGFYIIIKILLKNIFLEMMFNTKKIKNLKRRNKLNIKMLVSVLYRGLIEEYFNEVETKRNLEDLEIEEDRNNFMRIGYDKSEFNLEKMLKRKKKYILKADEERGRRSRSKKKRRSEDRDEERGSKKRKRKRSVVEDDEDNNIKVMKKDDDDDDKRRRKKRKDEDIDKEPRKKKSRSKSKSKNSKYIDE